MILAIEGILISWFVIILALLGSTTVIRMLYDSLPAFALVRCK